MTAATSAGRTAAAEPQVVVVAGASSGIGRRVAERFAARGAHLVLVARGVGPLQETAQSCLRAGAASAVAEVADVGDSHAVDALVARAVDEHGRVDVAVHVAGVVAYGRLEEVPREVWEHVQRTNLLGPVNLARAVLPGMRERRRGRLVVVGSLLGQIALPRMSAYVVSKWSVRGLGRCLALENRDVPDLRVSVVSPGGVDTPIYQQAATYLGRHGRPPAPVVSADRVARAVVGVVDRPRDRVSVGPANPLITLGFLVAPGVFDRLVGPLFDVAALDPDRGVADTAGNVVEPVCELEAVDGGHGQGGRRVLRAAAQRLRGGAARR